MCTIYLFLMILEKYTRGLQGRIFLTSKMAVEYCIVCEGLESHCSRVETGPHCLCCPVKGASRPLGSPGLLLLLA